MRTVDRRGESVDAGAGTPVSDVSVFAASASLTGLEFVFSMPGSVGGSVWMNARCYGASIADTLASVEYVDAGEEPSLVRMVPRSGDSAYKVSPFQSRRCFITRATFALRAGTARRACARWKSTAPTGFARGISCSPAPEAPSRTIRHSARPRAGSWTIWALRIPGRRRRGRGVHGNIVVNMGGAAAADVLAVLRHVERVAFEGGLGLEREVLLVGDWGNDGMERG